MRTWILLLWIVLAAPVYAQEAVEAIDFAKRYAGEGRVGDCKWTFEQSDIYRLARFNFEGPDGLRLKTGPADVGIGHCPQTGAVWAVVIPRKRGQLVSEAAAQMELLDHIWLRFHPSEVNKLFPPETIKGPGQTVRMFRMQRIAKAKFGSSFHRGPKAMLPPPGTFVVDADTVDNKRRFFAVETPRNRTQYMQVFERRTVPGVRLITTDDARKVIETAWKKFDETYAGFTLRPKVDWAAQREQVLQRLPEISNTIELGQALADMLRPLKDLHIWVRVDNEIVPVYRRQRETNGDLVGIGRFIPDLARLPGEVRWGRAAGDVGYIAIDSLRSRDLVGSFDQALAALEDTRTLIIDLRFNGGGNENLARKVAGRFTDKTVAYASSRVRNGPRHDDLGEKQVRKLEPRGPSTYTRPVYVLIGARCMSSAEALAGMLGELPQVKLVGAATAGSSGNPEELDLGHGIVVSLPRWIAYRADGEVLDGNGIVPDERMQHSTEKPLLRELLKRLD